MNNLNHVSFGEGRELLPELLHKIYGYLGALDKPPLYLLSKRIYHFFKFIQVETQGKILLNRTLNKINLDFQLSSSRYAKDEVERNIRLKDLEIFLELSARIQRKIHKQNPLPYPPCKILNLLSSMFNSLKIKNEGHCDVNIFEEIRISESSTFDIKLIGENLTLCTPFVWSKENRFKLVFKKHREKVYTDTYITKKKWHYWITLQKTDRSLMNSEELKLRIAIETYFNAIVKLACKMNLEVLPILFKGFKEESYWKKPIISCNKYGVFLKSKKLELGCIDKSLNEFDTCHISTKDLHQTIEYSRAQWTETFSFKSTFRSHVIDYSLQKYTKIVRAELKIPEEGIFNSTPVTEIIMSDNAIKNLKNLEFL